MLGRAQALVKKHFHGAQLRGKQLDLISFTTANKKRCVGSLSLTGDSGNRSQSGGLSQQPQLFKVFVEMGQTQINTNQYSGNQRSGGGGSIALTG